MKIREVVFAPSFIDSESTLHIDKIEELRYGQWTFASDNVLVGALGHCLCKRPLTTGYHLTQAVIIYAIYRVHP